MAITDYYLSLSIEKAVSSFVHQGGLMVAAFNNEQVPSWPALFPGVFGIKFGNCNNLCYDVIADNWYVSTDNLPLLRDGRFLQTKGYNSYAVSQFMGLLVHSALKLSIPANYQNLLPEMKRGSQKIRHPICQIDWQKWGKVHAPVAIVCYGVDGLFSEIYTSLRQLGYNILKVSDNAHIIPKSVPLNLYSSHLSFGICGLLSSVYPCDCIMIYRNYPSAVPNDIEGDIKISFHRGSYKVSYDNSIVKFQAKLDLMVYLKKCCLNNMISPPWIFW